MPRRSVGPFDLEIGFLGEPAYVGVPNAVFLDLSRGGQPVTDLGDALTVTVGFGDQTSDPFLFEPLEEPGQYQAPFVPSQAGAYTFTLSGTLEGVEFDLSLTSGPKTFDEVQDLAGATFPPVAGADERGPRVAHPEGIGSHDRSASPPRRRAAAADAQDAADSAKTIGIIGIVVGAIGLIFGIVAFTARGSGRNARVGARGNPGRAGRDGHGRRRPLARMGGPDPHPGQGVPPSAAGRRLEPRRRRRGHRDRRTHAPSAVHASERRHPDTVGRAPGVHRDAGHRPSRRRDRWSRRRTRSSTS